MNSVLFAVNILVGGICSTLGLSFTGRPYLCVHHKQYIEGKCEEVQDGVAPLASQVAENAWAGVAPSQEGGVRKMPGLAQRRCGKVALES